MARPALKLVYSQPLARQSDDLAVALLFAAFGLLCQFAFLATGLAVAFG